MNLTRPRMPPRKEPLKVQPIAKEILAFKDIQISTFVNEFYSKTSTNIKFKNTDLENPIELVLNLPLGKDTVMQSFEAIKGSEKIVSKVYKKEKAEEKFNDSIAQGNNAVLTTLSSDMKTINVNFGNLDANTDFEITIHTLQHNSTKDKSILFSHKPACLPVICNDLNIVDYLKQNSVKISYSIIISTSCAITRLISREIKMDKITLNFSKDLKLCNFDIADEVIKGINYEEFSFLFRTDDLSKEKIYEEYDDKLDVYTYNFNFLVDKFENIKPFINDDLLNTKSPKEIVDTDARIDYVEKFDSKIINDYPGSFVFLIDQSGSMSGNSITIAIEALVLFLKSLPNKCKFDIVGFGSSYNAYFNDVQEYDEKSIANAVKVAKSLKANLGGTNIKGPLNYIYSNSFPGRAKDFGDDMPRNIILLTDGAVDDPKSCCDIVSENKDRFKVHSIGIGTSVDEKFVVDIGNAGDGSYSIVPKVSDLKETIINVLNRASKPYLSKVLISLPEETSQSVLLSYPDLKVGKYFSQDSIFSFNFITSKKLNQEASIKISYYDSSMEQVFDKEVQIKDKILSTKGNDLNKLITGLKLCFDPLKEEEENEKLAVKYQVLSPFSALFAEIENDDKSEKIVKKIQVTSNEVVKSIAPKLDDDSRYYRNRSKGISLNSTTSTSMNIQAKEICKEKSTVPTGLNNIQKQNIISKPSMAISSPMPNNLNKPNMLSKMEKKEDLSKKKMKRSQKDIEKKLLCEDEDEEFDCLEESKSIINSLQQKESTIPDISLNQINQVTKITGPFKGFNNEFYQIIIDSQGVDGLWKKHCSDTISEAIRTNYKDQRVALEKILTEKGVKFNSTTSIEDYAQSIVVLIILTQKYEKLREEFKLIENKTIKALSKNGISYLEIIKLI